uniref:leucine-rich repeat-containing protein 34-like n=1 Tax=Styela clava TaxID=7725 RepID=UPI00193ACC52|nr:leucine-rich repeat-containing protein 34-like [Styela clava]
MFFERNRNLTMSTTAANETRERYTALCKQRNTQPHAYVLKALNKSAKDFLLSQTEEMHVDLAGNNKLLTQRRLEDVDVEILCSILSKSTVLASLDLRYNNFTDVGAGAVAKLIEESPCVKKINIMCNELTSDGAQKIASALHDNVTLRSLKMNGNKIGNKGGMYFAQALQINTKLRELDLGDTDQGTESMIALSTVLNQNRHLRALNINRPLLFSCQEETTVHFGKMLKVNHSLREIHMSKCMIRDFGMERLCEGLTDNYTLVYLDLSCNRITRDGAECMSHLLRKNTPLEILDLGYNRIEDDGAQYLSEAIGTYNSNLKALVVTSNCIEGKGLVCIAKSMKTNNVLSNVYIWGNNLEESACDAFRELIDRRRLLPKNTDVKPYEVDGKNYLAELSHGIKRFYYWTPSYGADVVGGDDDLL